MKARFLILSLLIFIYDCSNGQPKVESGAYNLMLKTLLSHDVNEIGVKQADNMSDSVIFLDSRTQEEYQVSHIKDAVWVGYEDFDSLKVEDVPKIEKVVVYCAVGARSEKVTEKLIDLGFSDVSNLYGGIFEWINQGYPVYKQDTVLTSDVHAYSKAWGIWLKKGNKVYD